ncbi:MAG TPA: FimV/HubP family polar landmark protein [Xanthomonadaceae bacterium]|nr:FimV/HubP family polar landmark protein [Xanthomonadaceae bacterium]
MRSGDTLAQIAGGLAGGGTLDQAMIALLRANPEAFIDGNINRIKAGAVLRTPSADEVSRIGSGEAAALVHEQIAGWRQARKPIAQPAGNAVAGAAPARPAKAVPPATAADARLEIAPPTSAHAKQAGTRSGLEAGGEGDMLRQQLQETKETLAARDAEVQELKTRVAELEKIRQDQQQLIQMKSSALATAQQDLAKSNRAAAAPAGAPATQTQAAGPPPQQQAHGAVWLWSGLGLLLVALGGWLLTRRRLAEAPTPRRFDSAALAASVPPREEPVQRDAERPVAAPAPARAPQPSPPAKPMPSWHAGQPGAQLDVLLQPEAPAPAVETDAGGPRSAAEQLDLAQAYLDVGDEEAARTLLREVLDGRDPVAREAAARLLREL